MYLFILFISFLNLNLSRSHDIGVDIYTNFPGGNIVVDSISGNDIYLSPDLRDTSTDWFYWYFAVKANQSGRLNFHLSGQNYLTNGGPAVSTDGGVSWQWLGKDFTERSFSYQIEAGKEVRFSMGMPYTQSHFDTFMESYRKHKSVRLETLCTTPKGRNTEKLVIGPRQASQKVLITARHHACEMMANYALEGFITTLLSDDNHMRRLRENVEFWIIPFMDKDGVEDGDQGKNRKPKDHNRDYNDESIYCSTGSLRKTVPAWSNGQLKAAIDLHCPWIKGNLNEHIYLVGNAQKKIEEQQVAFMQLLAKNNIGEVKFSPDNGFIAFGTAWNTAKNFTQGKSFSAWAAELEGIRLSTTFEIPYSLNEGMYLTPENLRAFGKDMAFALAEYLGTSEK